MLICTFERHGLIAIISLLLHNEKLQLLGKKIFVQKKVGIVT